MFALCITAVNELKRLTYNEVCCVSFISYLFFSIDSDPVERKAREEKMDNIQEASHGFKPVKFRASNVFLLPNS